MSSGPSVDFAAIAGPLFIGYLLNWGLYGVLSTQVYIYFVEFPNDRPIIRALVLGSYLLETVQTLMFTQSGFQAFATGYGKFEALDEVGTLWIPALLITGVMACITQCFYAYRIYILSGRSYYLTATVIALSLIQFVASIAQGVELHNAGHFHGFLTNTHLRVSGVWQGTTAFCDLLIAVCMSYYLNRGKHTAMQSTQGIVTRAVRIIVSTGVLTATVAITSFALDFLPGPPTYYQTCVAVLGKLYSNSMLVVLNSRIITRNYNSPVQNPSIPLIATTNGELSGHSHSLKNDILSGGNIINTMNSLDVYLDVDDHRKQIKRQENAELNKV